MQNRQTTTKNPEVTNCHKIKHVDKHVKCNFTKHTNEKAEMVTLNRNARPNYMLPTRSLL